MSHGNLYHLLRDATPEERGSFQIALRVTGTNPLDLLQEHELQQLGFTLPDPELTNASLAQMDPILWDATNGRQ